MSAYNNFQTSAGFPTGGAYTNMGYSRAPANVAAVGPAFLQYSEPHSHVELDAYDASPPRMTAPGLAPRPPVRTIEGLNSEIKEMKNKRCSKTRNRKADCRVGKAKRPEKKADVACGPCRGSETECGGQEPSCEQCVLANVQCVYGQRRRVRVKKAPQYSERQLLPHPEQSESLPSPPGLRIPPCPASLPAASGFGESAVGSGGGPSHPGLGRGHGLPTSELEARPPQAGFDMGHGLLEAAPDEGPGYAEFNWGFGGSVAQLDQAQGYYNQEAGQNFRQAEQRYPQVEQRYPQTERYNQQPQGYHLSLPLLQEVTRVGSARSRTPGLRSWLVDDCALLVGSRALRVRSYAPPASGTVVLEVDGSIVQHDVTFPFTWADFAAWPPETFLSVDGLVFRTVGILSPANTVRPPRDANPGFEHFRALLQGYYGNTG